MRASLDTAGELLAIDSSLPWVSDLVAEAAGGELRPQNQRNSSIRIAVEADRAPFSTDGWTILGRDARHRGGDVVVVNACTTGFDLHVRCTPRSVDLTYRWRPPARERVAARVLRSRFHLLARAVLIQYPALWWAGTRGRAPLHASACTVGGATPLLTAPSGVGRSTLLLAEIERGAHATGDNLAVGDGTTVFGLVEPLRVEGAAGRSMPHGRAEAPMRARAESLVPDSVIVLERGAGGAPSLMPTSPVEAARSLVTSTYAAGELRRFWAFAATLAAGTGFGPAHPPVLDVASAFSARLPCYSLDLGSRPEGGLDRLLGAVEVEACV